MAKKITLEDIQATVQFAEWKVVSTQYDNLDTQMEFLCNEGHKVYSTWRHLRAKFECPICKQNKYNINKDIIKPKKRGINRVLALDQASHKTGYAIFDGIDLIHFGLFETTEQDEVARFLEVKNWLLSMVELWSPDIIGIEGIQYQQNMGVTTFQTLARLQGILMCQSLELKIPYVVCPTNTWRAHCQVKGKARSDKKRSMQLLVKQWFDVSVIDDIADAIGIGKYVADTNQQKHEIINWE